MAEKDLRQSPLFAQFLKEIGWKVENLGSSYAYIKTLPLLGSVIKIHRLRFPIPFEKIDTLAKKYRALFIKIEPKEEYSEKARGKLLKKGFQEENWAFTPTKTIIIDLKLPLEEILARFEKDTRYSIRLAERKEVQVKDSSDFSSFIKLFTETAKRKGFWTGSLAEMEKKWTIFSSHGEASLLLAYPKGSAKLVAGAMVFFVGKTAYYLHAASENSHRDLMAPYLIIWETIKLSKKRGCSELDLEGIEDKRIPSTRKWHGFSHFKRGFGYEVTYLGSFTKFYNPIIKLIFKIGSLV